MAKRRISRLLLTQLLILLVEFGVAAAEAPSNSAMVGVRGGARDATSLVVGARARLVDSDLSKKWDTELSLRPKLPVGDYLEARLPVTVEFAITSRVLPFISLGAALNSDDFGHLDPMLGFGIDIALSRKLFISFSYDTIYQRRIPDHDTELILVTIIAL